MSADPSPLRPGEVAAMLRGTAATVQAELAALPAPAAGWHSAPGEWCVKETLGHIIEAERRGFAGRIRIMLDGNDPALEGWDQVAVERERRDCERDLAGLLEEFAGMREASAALVAGLADVDLQRGGHHPFIGYVRVVDLLHEWLHHDRNHLRQMLASVQAYVWPNMGSTQLFSQPH